MRGRSTLILVLAAMVQAIQPLHAEETPPAPAAGDSAQHATPGASPGETPAPPGEAPLGADVRKTLASPPASLSDAERADWQALSAVYEARKDEPLWVAKTGLNAKGEALAAEIRKADNWGLRARDYDLPNLAPAKDGGAEIARTELADADMKLSLAVLAYARDARGARIREPAKQLSSYLDRLPQVKDPKSVLDDIAAAGEPDAALRGLNPRHPQFEKLRQKYLEMTKAAASAKEIVVIPGGPKLTPGAKHAHVALIRKRLGVALPASNGAPPDETLYDSALVDAVKKFQSEKGARPDGIVGAATRALMNDVEVPSPARLLANMEEWRWMPDDMGTMYVWVNIPEFMIRVVKDGKIVLEERAITGEPTKQTPVFSDEMETIYFHPRWMVPESIKVQELYPSLARGGGTFQRQGLRLMYNGREVSPSSVDWSTADIRHFDIYQPSGGGNVLGVLKFAFPNKHGVYMHDTSSRGLFEEASRPFSHGCMRVRNPERLAEILLAEDKGWDAARIADMINAEPVEVPVTLDKKVPVHVTYFTAWIDDSGNEQDFKDVYGHEKRIELALEGKWSEIEIGPDHLAPVKFVRLPSSTFGFNDPFGFFFNSYGSEAPPPPGKPRKSKYKPSGNPFADIFSGF